jgi:hypothetical protein
MSECVPRVAGGYSGTLLGAVATIRSLQKPQERCKVRKADWGQHGWTIEDILNHGCRSVVAR